MRRPLLVIDGDLFAHRAYHALPKTIRRRGNKGAGAILGFANFLLRLYETEQPRAVLVGWDTLDAPTYRQLAFPNYQSGRQFDAELVDQLEVLPQFVTACGFACAKAPGYEADDFLASAVASERRRRGTAIVASGDRDAFQLASKSTTIVQPMRAGEMARIGRRRCGNDTGRTQTGARFHSTSWRPLGQTAGCEGNRSKGAARLLNKYGTLEKAIVDSRLAGQAEQLRLYRSIATMDASAPLPSLSDQTPTWAKASALARDWDLKRLADRLAELGRSTTSAPSSLRGHMNE